MNGCDPTGTAFHDVVRGLLLGMVLGVLLVALLNVLVGRFLRAWAGPGESDRAKGDHLLEQQ